METMTVAGLTLFFDAVERDAAQLIAGACKASVPVLGEHWGLDPPRDCRVYVLTSPLRFFFHSAPWPWRILLGVSVSLWAPRVQRTWAAANGWTQRYGSRRVVGVKPPRLAQAGQAGSGGRIFVVDEDMGERVRHTTCHELTHAFTAHLKLPMWLNEGLANVTVDHLAGRPTLQPATLASLGAQTYGKRAEEYRHLRSGDLEGLVYHFVRGYWLTRYLDETRPGLLRRLLSRRYERSELEREVAAALDLPPEGFWECIDGLVVDHFRG
jgi:hypothetical protein